VTANLDNISVGFLGRQPVATFDPALGYDGGVLVARPDVDRPDQNRWQIALPHSCDEWIIADAVTLPTAVEQLDLFIAALLSARDALASLPEAADRTGPAVRPTRPPDDPPMTAFASA
jgi:hypothetical protein